MIIDCHYHLEQRLLPVQTLLRKMDDCEVDKVALMGVINEPIPKPPEFLLHILRFAQTSFLNEKTTRLAIETLGTERCLFGTDGPYGVHGGDGLFDYGFIKRRIVKLFPDQGIQSRLLGVNFLEVADI